MTEEYLFIAQNVKGAIETQDGIYLPLKEVEELMKKYKEKQLIIPVVVKQSELFECRNVACNKMVKRNSGTVFCKKHRNL